MRPQIPRRSFLLAALGSLLVPDWRPLWAQGVVPHPEPRKGITGDRVATAEMLAALPHLHTLFADIRAIPHVVDGIRCHCGCAEADGYYSLLSCYEGMEAMAMWCPICQGEGRVAVRMAKAGRSLDEIRVAIDAQFG